MPRRIVVISGAGLSVGSGIRAFRMDTDSGKALWDEYDIEEVCNIHSFGTGYAYRHADTPPPEAVSKMPESLGRNLYELTNEFYNKRREELATVEPNAAHLRIGEWYKQFPDQVINLTTNVDDLLERSGIPRDEVLHVHGFLKEVKIEDAFTQKVTIHDVGYSSIEPDDYDWVKPNVVFFGEQAPLYSDMYALFDTLTRQDMVIVVGCSNQVINFNWELFPMLNIGTKMVVINPEINYLEQSLYEERGVLVYRAGAVETFSNPNFIKMVEDFLSGNIRMGHTS